MTNVRRATSRSPGVHSGDLVFDGTRVPVQTLLDSLDDGGTLEEFLAGFPTVERGQAETVLREGCTICGAVPARATGLTDPDYGPVRLCDDHRDAELDYT